MDGMFESAPVPADLAGPLPAPQARIRLVAEADRPRMPRDFAGAHEAIDAVARDHPDRAAVVGADGTVDYDRLRRRSDSVASALVALGVPSGGRVAVLVERGIELPAALLGVWKAGCAYVPLSSSHPRARRDDVTEQAAPAAFLVDEANLGEVPEGVPVLVLERVAETAYDLVRPVDPESVAYAIFTSGSTGRPKGVEVRHRSVTAFLSAMVGRPGISRDDVVLAMTTVAFDISVLEIFLPLCVGARLAMIARDEAADPAAAVARIVRDGVTLVQGTPTTLRMLLDAGFRAGPGLRVLSGGEPIRRDLADALLAGGCELWNVYGPTEATVWATAGRIDEGPVTVGTPIEGYTLHVLDGSDRPVPPGTRGHLHIGGAGVAKGYLGRPDLTAERFVDLPEVAPTTLYRTGDLAAELPDGRYVVAGRIDRQVKLRGFRIELGEIEAALGAVGLREVAVILREDVDGDPRLVAYYVDAGVDRREVRTALADLLPSHMVPSAFVRLDALPVGATGKVDYNALPAPPRRAASAAVPPPGSTLARLALVWSRILGVDGIEPADDFFDLGGHSIATYRLVTAVREEFGVRIDPRLVYERPTLGAMAALVAGGGAAVDGIPGIVTLKPDGDGTPVFVVHHPLLYREFAAQLVDRPVHAVLVPDGTDDPTLSYAAVAALYLAAVRRVRPDGPYVFAGFCFAARLAYEMARQARASGQEVELVIAFDAWAPGHEGALAFWPRLVERWAYRFHRLRHHAVTSRRGGWAAVSTLAERSDAVRRLVGAVRRAGPAPEEIREMDRAVRFDDACAAHLHVPADFPVLAVYGGDLPDSRFIDRTYGWGRLASDLTMRRVPGDHMGIWKGEGFAAMAKATRDALAVSASRPVIPRGTPG